MTSRPHLRRRVEPTEEWERIELLCGRPEQRNYELVRPLVQEPLFPHAEAL